MEENRRPEKRVCVCGSEMNAQGRQLLYLREESFFHLQTYADYVPVELYICPDCRRGDFFFPQDVRAAESVGQQWEASADAFYREQYETDSSAKLRGELKNPYLPEKIRNIIRAILAERGESGQDEPERVRADPWKEKEGKKGLFSFLFGDGDEKPRKNRPPEF